MNWFRLVVVLVALGVVVYLLAALRARRIRERYVWLWLIMIAGLGLLAAFPGLLSSLAQFFGFQVASNLVLTTAAIVTFLVTVSLSGAVSALQMSVRTLTEEVAFLHWEVEELRSKGSADEAVDALGDPEYPRSIVDPKPAPQSDAGS